MQAHLPHGGAARQCQKVTQAYVRLFARSRRLGLWPDLFSRAWKRSGRRPNLLRWMLYRAPDELPFNWNEAHVRSACEVSWRARVWKYPDQLGWSAPRKAWLL